MSRIRKNTRLLTLENFILHVAYTFDTDFTFPATGDGPVATCFRTKSEITIMDIGPDTKMKRRSLAMEFGIGNVHFIPCESGVLEYGTGRGG